MAACADHQTFSIHPSSAELACTCMHAAPQVACSECRPCKSKTALLTAQPSPCRHKFLLFISQDHTDADVHAMAQTFVPTIRSACHPGMTRRLVAGLPPAWVAVDPAS